MRTVKTLFLLPAAALLWYGYGAYLEATMPKVEIRDVAPLAAQNDKTLPFFELMSPLPALDGGKALPKLEYKKGPPDRFLERISVLLERSPQSAKERIVYYGRHTREDLRGIGALPEEPSREAHYIETAIRTSQGLETPALSGLKSFLYRPLYLAEAAKLLNGFDTVTIMDQAGTPAFLFTAAPGDEGRTHSTALFIRRSSFYRVEYLGDRGYSVVDPERLFRKTFLTERRSDALEYIARNLSEVKLQESQKSLPELAWPILLLAANVSVDPASLDSYFHFAGLNALLYRNTAASSTAVSDLEISDALRNNVLSSDLYARDIAPEAAKTAEIARFARLLTRNFDQ
ncbi:MAG: hypothetical protein ACXVB9_02745 [Bdellovibrionota bacterium]